MPETASATTYLVKPVSRGWTRLARIEPLPGEGGEVQLQRYGDGISFPQIEPWSKQLNFHLPQFEMQFPLPDPAPDLLTRTEM